MYVYVYIPKFLYFYIDIYMVYVYISPVRRRSRCLRRMPQQAQLEEDMIGYVDEM